MEDALVLLYDLKYLKLTPVLILVLMEDALVQHIEASVINGFRLS